MVKRSLNIPICEVTYDAEYEREVRPTYELPASYVKHVKKVGGEADLSLEYIADRDDEVRSAFFMSSRPPKMTHRRCIFRCG